MQALVVDEGRGVEDVVGQIYARPSAGSAAEVVVGSVEGIAAELDVKASDAVGSVVVEAMAQVVCTSESEYVRLRTQGRPGPACGPAESDLVTVGL